MPRARSRWDFLRVDPDAQYGDTLRADPIEILRRANGRAPQDDNGFGLGTGPSTAFCRIG